MPAESFQCACGNQYFQGSLSLFNVLSLRTNESWSQGHPRTKLGSSVGQPHSNHGSPRQVVPRVTPQVHPRRTPGAPQVHPSRPHPGVIPAGHTLGPTPPGCMQDDPCGDHPRVCPRGAPRVLWGWPTDQLWMSSAGASHTLHTMGCK